MKKGNILNNKVSVVSAVIISLLLGVTQGVQFGSNNSNDITVVKEYKNERSVSVSYDSVELAKTIDKEVVKDVDRVEVVNSNDRVEVVKKTQDNKVDTEVKTNDTETNKITKEVTEKEIQESVMFNEKYSLTTSEVILEEKINKSEAQKKKEEKNALKNIGNNKVVVELVEPRPVINKTTTTKMKTVAAGITKKVSATSQDLMYLACIIFAEAGGESYSGKLAVANVVLNRKKNRRYPNSIYGVISQRGQFGPYRNGSLNRAISKYKKGYFTRGNNGYTQSLMAAKSALNGNNNIGNRLSFNGKRYSSNKRNQKIIGNHRFW